MLKIKSKILIVEDESIEAMGFEQMLKSSGFDVVGVASTGQDAIDKAGDLIPDLILMDIILKGEMDGIEAAAQIKELYDLPFIYLTAHPEESTVKRAKLTSPYGYLIKPVNKNNLKNTIELAIYKHEMDKKLKEKDRNRRKIQDKLYHVMDNLMEGCQIISPDWRYLYVNNAVARQGKVSKEDLLGHTMMEVYPGIEDTELFEVLSRCMKEQDSHQMDNQFIYPDGSVGWHKLIIEPVPEGIFILSMEITDQVKTQEELQKSENRYRELVDTSLVGVLITRPEGEVIFANKALLEMLEQKDLKGSNIIQFYNHPQDWDELLEILQNECKVNQFETEFKKLDRKIINVLISAHLSKDKISGTIIDITDKKKAIDALRVSENKYHGLYDNAADGIILMKDNVFIDCNKRALDIYGTTKEQIIGETPYRFSPQLQDDGQPSKERAVELIGKALEGQPQHFRWKHLRYDSTPFYADISLNRIKIGQEYLLQSIVRDITELKKAEELEEENIKLQELDKLKSMFIASMSHELRTPLNSIIGFTGILLQGLSGELNEEQRKQLNIVRNSSSHLLDLINDVIDISKIEADKVELYTESFDLTPVLRDMVHSFQDMVVKKGINLEIYIPESMPVYGDERRIKQVLMNLLSNAVKFTDKGGVTLDVAQKEGLVEVTVRDTGMGIREENQEKLFKAFSRIQVEDQPIVEGTGLGLYLSQKIARLIGGEIKVRSKFNQGSEFTFTFPSKYQELELTTAVEDKDIPGKGK